jgi:hypothetical protein
MSCYEDLSPVELMYQDSIAAEKNLTIRGVVKWSQSWQDHRGHLMFFHHAGIPLTHWVLAVKLNNDGMLSK